MQPEPLITWSDPVKEFVGFIALFLGAGAIGFRYFALRGWRIETDRPFYDDAARRAAGLGIVGVILSLIMVWIELPGLAARKHVSSAAFATSDPTTMMQIGFLVLALIGYALASGAIKVGWPLAAY